MKTTKNSTWNQKLYSSNSLKGTIKYIFSSAKKNHTPHAEIMKSIKERVYDDAKYTTLPNYMQSTINGYIEANYDIMYFHLEFCHWYNGKFIGKNLVYNESFKQELIDKSEHVYIGTQNIY
jgi:hypothetical protein